MANSNEILQIEQILNDILVKAENLNSEINKINTHYDDLIHDVEKRSAEVSDLDRAIEIINKERQDKLSQLNNQRNILNNLAKYYISKYKLLSGEENIKKINEDILSQKRKIELILKAEQDSLKVEVENIILKIDNIISEMEQIDSNYKESQEKISTGENASADQYIKKFGEGIFIIPDDKKKLAIECIETLGGIPSSLINDCQEYTFKDAVEESIFETKRNLDKEYLEKLEALDSEKKSLEIKKRKLTERLQKLSSNVKLEDLSDSRLNYISEEKRNEVEETLKLIRDYEDRIKETEDKNLESKKQMENYSGIVNNQKKSDDDAPSY